MREWARTKESSKIKRFPGVKEAEQIEWCKEQGGKWRKNICEVPDAVINATLKNALIHAMGTDFLLLKDNRQVRLIMEQHPDYRTALYPVLDVVEGRYDDFNPIWRELTVKYGYTTDDFSGGQVFKTSDVAMEFIRNLKDKGFTVALESPI